MFTVMPLAIILLLVFGVPWTGEAQQVLPQSLPDQLTQCTALLRVKRDLPCRCDGAEMLARELLIRAEKAEEELSQVHQQLLDAKKTVEPKAVESEKSP